MTRTKLAWYLLIAATMFSALSAVGGSIAMLVTDGLGMPRVMLEGSPFDSFAIPAVVLLVIVGGTQVLAAVQLLRRAPSALLWAAIAGFGMTIWIVVETVVIRGFSALQGIYLATGLAQIALVVALLGVVAWVPRTPWGAPAAS